MIAKKYRILGEIGVFLLLILGSMYWFFFLHTKTVPEETVKTFDVSRLGGTFYMTVPDEGMRKSSIVSFTPSAPMPVRFFSSEWTMTKDAAFSPDGLTMAYVGEYGEGQIPQIFFVKTNRTGMGQISLDANRLKRSLVWNAHGTQLAYAARVQASSSEEALSSYQTFVTDLTGSTSAIAVGVPQFFSPDGTSLFILQRGGLRILPVTPSLSSVDTMIGTNSVVEAPNARISSSTKLARATQVVLSPDRHKLVWTFPEQGSIQVFAIQNWAPFNMVLEKEFSIQATNPVFSPDGTMLALLEEGVDPARRSLVVYEIDTERSHTVLDFSLGIGEHVELSAWR